MAISAAPDGHRGILAAQVAGLPCACLQVDEANIPGNPADAPLAADAINRVFDRLARQRPSTCVSGTMAASPSRHGNLARAHGLSQRAAADHLVLELAHRPAR